ncbi:TIGR02301 family protein [Ancylobacter oerskovii]|nr:TIGR02301 family protein [Ancylobacter oerskovii]
MVAISLALALPPPAGAQGAPPNSSGSTPPYEADMLRLAEMLGTLHYIRPLCGAPDAARWREEMQALIDAEQPSDARRGLMIAAFNRGYESYRQVYHSCTPSAELAAQRYLEAGARLSRDIAARYGSN